MTDPARPRASWLAPVLAAAPLLVGALACKATRSAPEPPPELLALTRQHFSGSVRTGALAAEPALEGTDVWQVVVDVRFVAELPSSGAARIEQRAQRVVQEASPDPLRSVADLARGVRVANDELVLPSDEPDALSASSDAKLDEFLSWSAQAEGWLWPGTALAFRAERLELPLAPEPSWEALAVEVSRPATGLRDARAQLAVVLSGWCLPRVDDIDDAGDPESDSETVELALVAVPRTERLILDVENVPGAQHLLFPAPTEATPYGGYVVTVHTGAVDEAGTDVGDLQDRLQRARAELQGSTRRAREHVGLLAPTEGLERESGSAVRALEFAHLQRPALIFLSRTLEAPFLADLALAASDADLEQFTASVGEIATAVEASQAGTEAYPWLLDSAAWRFAALRTAEDVADPPPELEALLLRHAGEPGRYSDLVLDLVAECAGLDDLDRRLVEENTIFLEDGDPAARVRAFDWLDARGLAPDGYDPLGTRAERRAALAANDPLNAERAVDDTSNEEDAR